MSKELQIFADYFQVFVTTEIVLDDNPAWTDAEFTEHLALVETGFVISTFRNMEVKVKITCLNQKPVLEVPYDLMTEEHQIFIEKDELFIYGPSDYIGDIKKIKVNPGLYKYVVVFYNLSSISEDGLNGDELYEIILWEAK
jgi:hypothetical protein